MSWQIILTEGALSDVWFNHEHFEYDRLHAARATRKADPPDDTEVREALMLDAVDFGRTVGETSPEFAAWLVNDFMGRR